jgi:hypothetical protein
MLGQLFVLSPFPNISWVADCMWQQVDDPNEFRTSKSYNSQEFQPVIPRLPPPHPKICPTAFTIARLPRPLWSNLAKKLSMALRPNEADNKEFRSKVHKDTLLPPWDTVEPLDATETKAAAIRTKAHAALVQVFTHECREKKVSRVLYHGKRRRSEQLRTRTRTHECLLTSIMELWAIFRRWITSDGSCFSLPVLHNM